MPLDVAGCRWTAPDAVGCCRTPLGVATDAPSAAQEVFAHNMKNLEFLYGLKPNECILLHKYAHLTELVCPAPASGCCPARGGVQPYPRHEPCGWGRLTCGA